MTRSCYWLYNGVSVQLLMAESVVNISNMSHTLTVSSMHIVTNIHIVVYTQLCKNSVIRYRHTECNILNVALQVSQTQVKLIFEKLLGVLSWQEMKFLKFSNRPLFNFCTVRIFILSYQSILSKLSIQFLVWSSIKFSMIIMCCSPFLSIMKRKLWSMLIL